jgi:hypothetical protein
MGRNDFNHVLALEDENIEEIIEILEAEKN